MKSLFKAVIYTSLIVLFIYLLFAFWFVVLPLTLFFFIWIMVSANLNHKKIMEEDKPEETNLTHLN